MRLPSEFLDRATRILFFTGKGGVGKTSLSCANENFFSEITPVEEINA